MTVQEATNSMAQRRVVRVTPTMDAGTAYAAADVLFNSTEIPNAVLRPGGCSKLQLVALHNHKDATCDLDIVFTQKQVNLGTINDAVGSGSLWTETLSKGAKVLGHMHMDVSDNELDLINSLLHTAAITPATTVIGAQQLFLQAEEDSTSVYFSAIDRTGSIDFGADDLEFIFHIEY